MIVVHCGSVRFKNQALNVKHKDAKMRINRLLDGVITKVTALMSGAVSCPLVVLSVKEAA